MLISHRLAFYEGQVVKTLDGEQEFVMKDYIAYGGSGVVYLAEDSETGRTLAVKVPHPHVREHVIGESKRN